MGHLFRSGESNDNRSIRRAIIQKFYTLDQHCEFLTEDEWNTVDALVGSNIYKETTHRGQKEKNAYTTAMHEAHSGRKFKGKDHTNHVIQGSNRILNFLLKSAEPSENLNIILNLLLECAFIIEQDENVAPNQMTHSCNESKYKAEFLAKFKEGSLVSNKDFEKLKQLTIDINLNEYLTNTEKSGTQRRLF
ncbi:MAG: hypothetical protein ACON35_00775 [Candidatus Marinamargulisbacteria bacterium]